MNHRKARAAVLAALSFALPTAAALAAGPTTTRLDVDANGRPLGPPYPTRSEITPDGRHVLFYRNGLRLRDLKSGTMTDVPRTRGLGYDMSDDARLIAFESLDNDLVPGDTNQSCQTSDVEGRECEPADDVFVRDRKTGRLERVSVSSHEAQGNDRAFSFAISGNGRYVAFGSVATNLVRHDTNRAYDIFVRDRHRGTTRRVSVARNGSQANGASSVSSMSRDGRFVLFESSASNLVRGDTNGDADVFVRDLKRHRTTRVSVGKHGRQANADSALFAVPRLLSADGRVAVFYSRASNLVAGDENHATDVYARDLRQKVTKRVSVAPAGEREFSFGLEATLSADGRWAAFSSVSPSRGPGESLFLRDLKRGTTRYVSVGASGEPGNGFSAEPSLSGDGRWITFSSEADNLGPPLADGDEGIFLRGPLR